MANYSLFMALFWLVVGALVICYHQFVDNAAFGTNIFGTGLSAGWLAIVLVIYNLIRWNNNRSKDSPDQAAYKTMMEERRRRNREGRHDDQPPDPNFNFSDRPEEGKR